MAKLILKNLENRIVRALKRRATRHGRSVEVALRAILEVALNRTRRRSLAQVLAKMPDVGRDADFARTEAEGA